MKKQNKNILIGLFLGFIVIIAMSAYLLLDDGSMDKPPVVSNEKGISKKSHDIVSEAETEKKPVPGAAHETPAPLSKPTDAGASESPYVSYPETLVELLGIDMNELVEERDAFKSTIIHIGWMDRINEILKNLDPEKKAAIIKNHTSLLYIKDKLNEAYLTGKIDHETFKKALADLMKWHQRSYESILTDAEYEALFEITPDLVDDTIDAIIDQTPDYSFILNQEIPADEVAKQVQGYKLEEVNSHFKRMILDRDALGKQINSGEVTLDQARWTLNESQQVFIGKCKEILTEDEINTIFGSVEALESGATQTEAPKVLGDTDEMELGFKIENPITSIENVTEKIDQNKIGDIKFFYQQRAMEREELIEKLEAGELTPEDIENMSNEMDAVFEDNCRDTLTTDEYQLLFDNPENKEPVEPPAPETLKE
jgi:hypothetical protein